MDQVNFTKVEDAKNIESGFVYLGRVFNSDHGCEDYEFLIFRDGDFLIWIDDESGYFELEDNQELMSIAKLGGTSHI